MEKNKKFLFYYSEYNEDVVNQFRGIDNFNYGREDDCIYNVEGLISKFFILGFV